MPIKNEITDMLLNAGFEPQNRGFNYVRDSILFVSQNKAAIHTITKELYPAIAANYNTTASRVERAIRHEIELAVAKKQFLDVFGEYLDGLDKPTNSRFIALCVEILEMKAA